MPKSGIVFLAVFLCSAPALAHQANNPVPSSANDSRTSMSQPDGDTVSAANAPWLDEIVCKNEPPPAGTRIGGRRVCKANREWRNDEDAMNRQRGFNADTDFAHGPGVGGTCACAVGNH